MVGQTWEDYSDHAMLGKIEKYKQVKGSVNAGDERTKFIIAMMEKSEGQGKQWGVQHLDLAWTNIDVRRRLCAAWCGKYGTDTCGWRDTVRRWPGVLRRDWWQPAFGGAIHGDGRVVAAPSHLLPPLADSGLGIQSTGQRVCF